MQDVREHKFLILGWPLKEPQAWLKNYPEVRAERIYIEGLSRWKRKLQSVAFRAPHWLTSACPPVAPFRFYGDWKYDVEQYDTVIIIDEVRGRDIFEFILGRNPQCNICVFYDWSIQRGSKRDPSRYSDLPVRFYTCDRNVAAQYGLEFRPYFYIFAPSSWRELEKFSKNKYHIEQDVFFIGEEKGDRTEKLQQIAILLDEAGLSHQLVLVGKRRGKAARKQSSARYMPYPEVLKHVLHSRAVLELVSNGQTGLTQRSFEALFLHRKLITDSPEVMNYDFYREQNIFVLGKRPLSHLPEFLNTAYEEIPAQIMKQYTLRKWLEGFHSTHRNS